MRLTDRRTDIILIARQCLHSMQHGVNNVASGINKAVHDTFHAPVS